MAKRKKHNPERKLWKGRSYKKGGKRIRHLREKMLKIAMVLATALLSCCGDNLPPPHTCVELGCKFALCDRHGECTCYGEPCATIRFDGADGGVGSGQ